MSSDNRQKIGDFLRQKREGLSPEVVGLPRPARTRTPGLRREDVAMLAGVSSVWYSKIERGKAKGISYPLLVTLGEVLRLTPAEKDYLHNLAVPTGDDTLAAPTMQVCTHTQFLLTTMNPLPALLINDYYDILAGNESFNRFCGFDVNALPQAQRNYALLTLTDSRWQRFLRVTDEASLRAKLLLITGMLRSVSAARPNDSVLRQRLALFQKTSALFTDCWHSNMVVQRPQELDITYHHARLGELAVHKQLWSNISGDTRGRLHIYAPQNPADFLRLQQLMAEPAS